MRTVWALVGVGLILVGCASSGGTTLALKRLPRAEVNPGWKVVKPAQGDFSIAIPAGWESADIDMRELERGTPQLGMDAFKFVAGAGMDKVTGKKDEPNMALMAMGSTPGAPLGLLMVHSEQKGLGDSAENRAHEQVEGMKANAILGVTDAKVKRYALPIGEGFRAQYTSRFMGTELMTKTYFLEDTERIYQATFIVISDGQSGDVNSFPTKKIMETFRVSGPAKR